MSVRRAVLDLLILFLVLPTTRAALVNYTIDDTFGDSVTGAKPVYLPASPWAGPGCTTCAIVPVKALAFDGTWTAATYNPSLFNNMNITFSFTGWKISSFDCLQLMIFAKPLRFTGISIWVFFILANNNTLPGITSNTQCNFTLDGQLVNTFNHQPNGSTNALQYNATAFTTSGLSNSQHTLVISTNDFPGFSFLNFDYAIYTYVYFTTPACISATDVILGLISRIVRPYRLQGLPAAVELVSLIPPQKLHKAILQRRWGLSSDAFLEGLRSSC